LSPDAAREKMMQDLHQAGVTDDAVLAVMAATPREMFLTEHFKAQAYEDATLPIGHHQTLSAPAVVANMTEALEITDRMTVLEIGTGSGYQAAVLAQLCRRLYSIERHPPLLKDAQARFDQMGLVNITTMAGDGSLGWPEQAPFERIMVTAAAADVPDALLEQLAVGGIMIVPVGLDDSDQHLLKLRRGESDIETEDLGPTRFVPLVAGLAAH